VYEEKIRFLLIHLGIHEIFHGPKWDHLLDCICPLIKCDEEPVKPYYEMLPRESLSIK